MKRLSQRHGFITAPFTDGNGRTSTVARFICQQCEAHGDIPLKSGESLNPEALANTIRQRGWDAHFQREQDALCPACKAAKPANDPDSELHRLEAKMSLTPAVVALHPEPPAPTTNQRVQIRHLLEANFDEGLGCFSEGWHDERIAEEIGVVRAVVERMREAAYGPIKVSPAMQRALADIAKLEVRLAPSEKAFPALLDRFAALEAEIKAIRTTLDGVRAVVNGRTGSG